MKKLLGSWFKFPRAGSLSFLSATYVRPKKLTEEIIIV